MNLGQFLQKLDSLANNGKPHRHLLLLSVLDLVERHGINRFYFNQELRALFTSYFNRYGRETDRDRPYTPFFHLVSSGFWELVARPGRERELDSLKKPGSPRDITDNVDHARFIESVWELLADDKNVLVVRNHLISILTSKQPALSFETENVAESLFDHEKSAIDALVRATSKLGAAVSNVSIYDPQSTTYFEYDLILVAHTGIYVIELKHWSGEIALGEYNWLVNGSQYRPDPHRINSLKCKILKGIYQRKFPAYPNIWVQSIVVFTNRECTVAGADKPEKAISSHGNLTFPSINDFVTFLRLETENYASIFNIEQIRTLQRGISDLAKPKAVTEYKIPGYETVEYLAQQKDYLELVARPVGGGKGLYRFRVFRAPPNLPLTEKQRFEKRAYQTRDAVDEIGEHPNVHRVWLMHSEVGDIIEGSEWSETGTLRDLMGGKQRITQCESEGILVGVISGLMRLHESGIIHRAVKPENILMMNTIPRLMNFDISYQIEDNRLTVVPDLSQVKDDRYTAPEILEGADIDEATDFYSVGVIAYELMTGSRPFANVKEFARNGGRLTNEALERLSKTGVQPSIQKAILQTITLDRKTRLRDAEQLLQAFSEDAKPEPQTVNRVLLSGERYDTFEIMELVGQGAQAQVYRAKTLNSVEVAIKLFNREVSRGRLMREYEVASAISSSYVCRCQGRPGLWKNERFFLVFDWIEGESLREKIERQQVPDAHVFRSVALSLIEGLAAFHRHTNEDGVQEPILHNDVKPDNVLVTRDWKPVLIDCGIADSPKVGAYAGTAGYIPPDCIMGADIRCGEDTDLFALGVTLWEWAFGSKPYEVSIPAIGDVPEDPAHASEELRQFLPWLAQSVGTLLAERYSSIEDMRSALIGSTRETTSIVTPKREEADEDYGDQEVPDAGAIRTGGENLFVSYLASLSNASAANQNATAESQLTNPLFRRISVTNPVSSYIFDQLTGSYRVVILTGNAGDGKTTIAADVFERMTGTRRAMKAIEESPENNLVIIKDMSELSAKDRTARLRNSLSDSARRYLIVSNTGTLYDTWRSLRASDESMNESQILEALGASAPTDVLDGTCLVVNIGRMDSIENACRVLGRMVEQSNWEFCTGCGCNGKCPILFNVDAIRSNLGIVQQRVSLAYRRIQAYGARLTMRQMTGHLAYAITGSSSCTKIQRLSNIGLRQQFRDHLFADRFMGDDGQDVRPEALQLVPVIRIREAGLGTIPDPSFERLASRPQADLGLPPMFVSLLSEITKREELASHRTRCQARRLVFFFGSRGATEDKRFAATFLRSPMLSKYLGLVSDAGIGNTEERYLRTRVLQVFQEHIVGLRLPERQTHKGRIFVTAGRASSRSSTRRVIAELRADDFYVTADTQYMIDTLKWRNLGLIHTPSKAFLPLDLPFLDYVHRRYEGGISEDISPYYADRMERFKAHLLDHHNTEPLNAQSVTLVRMNPNREFEVMRIDMSGDKLEVTI